MVPIKLTLRNFMSYGDERTELDFTGMRVACLSGDNGNGKSALLDAMTYALWGKTRGSASQSSSEDDIVRLGADEMEVQFEFRLGDDSYRAIRRRNKAKRVGDWQLHLFDSNGGWKPVGGTGIRETERQLVKLLRMEYETFYNSAYLQQGRADEFTRQKPDARKRILADILDLGRYDRLEQMARDRKGECDLAAKDLEGEIRALDASISEEAALREALAKYEPELERWSEERAERVKQLQDLRAQMATLEEKARRLQEREQRLGEAVEETNGLNQDLARIAGAIAQNQKLIADKDQIDAEYTRLQEARACMERLAPEIEALHVARQAQTDARSQLELARVDLVHSIDRARDDCNAAEQRAVRAVDLEKRLKELAPQLTNAEALEREHDAAIEELKTVDQEHSNLVAKFNHLTREIKDTKDVLALLNTPRPSCPVCGTDLGFGKREAVIKKQTARVADLERKQEEVRLAGTEKRKTREGLRERHASLKAKLKGVADLRAQRLDCQRNLDEIRGLQGADAGARTRLSDLEARLKSEDYGKEVRAELARQDKEIARLETVAKDYESAHSLVRELTERRVEGLYAECREAERVLSGLEADKADRVSRLAKQNSQIDSERGKIDSLRTELAGHETVRAEVARKEQGLQEAETAFEQARSLVDRARHALEGCARDAEVRAVKATERDKILKDRQAYTDLAAAFGRRGVQALIIDNALPEIEEETNRLLARMTDNAMRVTLTTLRTARGTGTQIETLDIRITDDLGTRPYEMFSGGEAFRANFAMRIALSRLLARRAGARLQTLIVDEGFGTQDSKGRERLVEVIESVKDEFELILVISHIEELKDAFPTRIEVSKTPSGSRINYLD